MSKLYNTINYELCYQIFDMVGLQTQPEVYLDNNLDQEIKKQIYYPINNQLNDDLYFELADQLHKKL